MSEMSPRRPRLSGPGPALLVALLGMMVLFALGFAVWGLVIYPATATDTPLPIVGTLTAIAEVATSPLTETTPVPSTATATSEASTVASPTPEASPSATSESAAAEPTATPPPAIDTATPAPTETTAAPTDTPPPPTPTPRPRVVNAFGYGIQAHALGNVNHKEIMATIQDLGFGWLKQQIEWKRYESAKGQYDWAEIDRLVDVAHQNDIYLLLSVVKAPEWARGSNPDTSVEGPPTNSRDLADFVGAMAARYKGRVQAYEIWNEQNLHYEWGNEQIDAARYVQLLAVAYQAIKEADPQALVISGALTPTGGDGGVRAVEDKTYLRQMYDAGLKNVCDGVGIHPNGYNIPPHVDWQTYQDPNAQFRGLWDTPHYSWSFRGMMEVYRQIMVEYGDANKLLWVTEFGWAVEASPPGGREYAADNTREEQRDWTITAYQMGKSWGWVGPMFLWNLNFQQIVPWSEQGMWSIIAGDGSPQPVYFALRDMPK